MTSKSSKSLFILLISTFFFSVSTMGRSPAVEPITGISIDKYRDVNPKNDPGFNWKQDSSRHVRLMPETSSKTSDYSSASSITTTIVFLLSIAAFPIALWFTLMKAFPSTPSHSETPAHQSVMIDLAAERSRRSDNVDDENEDDVHKAS